MNLEQVLSEKLNLEFKGYPATAGNLRVDDIGKQNWSLLKGDLPLPTATLKESVLENNSRWMRLFTKKFRANIAPHGKTTMSPQLFKRQLDDCAWAITVANVHQLRLCRQWKVERVLMANQVVGRQNLRELVRELAADPEFDFYLLADSVENIEQLAKAAEEYSLKRPIQVLMELGFPGGRTGCRTIEASLSVACAVKSFKPRLALRGVEGYEALLKTRPDSETKICGYLSALNELAFRCARDDLFADGPVILSAGGSDYFDLVLKELEGPTGMKEVVRLIRSGCYLTHDSLNYQRIFERILSRSPEARDLSPGLLPALQVWGVVQSCPEPELAIVNVGKRDISYDIELPVPELSFRPDIDSTPQALSVGCRVRELNDQHAYVEISDGNELRVGDLVAFGISHPCTTFDKWRLLYLVDDDYRVTGGIRTFMA